MSCKRIQSQVYLNYVECSRNSLSKKTASIAHVISEKLSRNAPKGAKKSQQESITQVNKHNELKTEQNGQEQSKHFMDHKDSNRYRFKSSRVAWNATE